MFLAFVPVIVVLILCIGVICTATGDSVVPVIISAVIDAIIVFIAYCCM